MSKRGRQLRRNSSISTGPPLPGCRPGLCSVAVTPTRPAPHSSDTTTPPSGPPTTPHPGDPHRPIPSPSLPRPPSQPACTQCPRSPALTGNVGQRTVHARCCAGRCRRRRPSHRWLMLASFTPLHGAPPYRPGRMSFERVCPGEPHPVLARAVEARVPARRDKAPVRRLSPGAAPVAGAPAAGMVAARLLTPGPERRPAVDQPGQAPGQADCGRL